MNFKNDVGQFPHVYSPPTCHFNTLASKTFHGLALLTSLTSLLSFSMIQTLGPFAVQNVRFIITSGPFVLSDPYITLWQILALTLPHDTHHSLQHHHVVDALITTN